MPTDACLTLHSFLESEIKVNGYDPVKQGREEGPTQSRVLYIEIIWSSP